MRRGTPSMLLLLPALAAAAWLPARMAPRAAAPSMSAPPCKIQVLGIGGGGGNAVGRMIAALGDEEAGVEFITCNTDVQALAAARGRTLQLGGDCTRGLGAGGRPAVGAAAAAESANAIRSTVGDSDMVFVTAGMGGGTGSGAAPVVASLAREGGALTVGVVSTPFGFEGRRRATQAAAAVGELREACDMLIVVSNDRLLDIAPDGMSMIDSFRLADEVLRQGIVGLSDLVLKPGIVNVDFADVRTIMAGSGLALMGVGRGFGEGRAEDAAGAAISSPLLEFPMAKARRVVFSVTGGPSMSLQHVNAVAKVVSEVVDADANIIFGASVDEAMGDELSVTVVATDFPEEAYSA